MINVLVGLPGSGKTFFAKKRVKTLNYFYVDGDQFLNNPIEKLIDYIKSEENKHTKIIVDGLFLTRKIQQIFIDAFSDNGNNGKIIFTYFSPDREACLYNDKKRNREINAEITIKNAKIERPNPSFLHEVITVKKFNYVNDIMEEIKIKDFEIQSERWCTGGTYGTCWDEDEGPTELGEEEALPYDSCSAYTKILQYYFSNWENYIEKYSFCLDEITEDEADYYGGCAHYSLWDLDADILIRNIVYDLYGVENIEKIKETHPELFL